MAAGADDQLGLEDQPGAVDTAPGRVDAPPPAHAAPERAAPQLIQPPRKPVRRTRLWIDLTLLGVVFILLIAAVIAAWNAIQREFYSPSAFVERYIDLLAEGQAADALAVPGVAVSSAELEAAGLPPTSDEALLREAALAPIDDVRVLAEEVVPAEGDGAEPGDEIVRVTVAYEARGYAGETTFEVERDGYIGLSPTWRFAESPLAVMNLTVTGSMSFDVNGFTVDKRQVSPEGVDADPLAPVSLLVFSPGLYSVSVDTAISSTPGVAVLSDSPFRTFPVEVQAQPTPEFVAAVQEEVEKFLTSCATQEVLQPTACPFGFYVQDRIDSLPAWSIASQPTVSIEPDGAGWTILPAEAVAHIEVDIRSIFDGKVRPLSEDVPFIVEGRITVQPDGRASIVVTGPNTN